MTSTLDYGRSRESRDSRLQPYTAAGTSWNSVRWAKPSAGYHNLRSEKTSRLFGNVLGSSSSPVRSRYDQYSKTSTSSPLTSSVSDYRLRSGSAIKALFTGSRVDRTPSYTSPSSSYSYNRFSSAPSSYGRRSSLALSSFEGPTGLESTSRSSSRRNSLSLNTAALESDLSKLSQYVSGLKDPPRSTMTSSYALSNSWPNSSRVPEVSSSRRSSVTRDLSGTSINYSPSTSSIRGGNSNTNLDSAFRNAAARASSTNYSSRLNSSIDRTGTWESRLLDDNRRKDYTSTSNIPPRRSSLSNSRLTDSGIYTNSSNYSNSSSYKDASSNYKPMTTRLASGRISRFLKPKAHSESLGDESLELESSGDDISERLHKKRRRKKNKGRDSESRKSDSSEEDRAKNGIGYKGSVDYKIMSRRRRLNRSKAMLDPDAIWKPKPRVDPPMLSPKSAVIPDVIQLALDTNNLEKCPVTIIENQISPNLPEFDQRLSPIPPLRSGFSKSPTPKSPVEIDQLVDLRPLTQIERELTPKPGTLKESSPKILTPTKCDANLTSIRNCERILEEAKAQLLTQSDIKNNTLDKNGIITKNVQAADTKIDCSTRNGTQKILCQSNERLTTPVREQNRKISPKPAVQDFTKNHDPLPVQIKHDSPKSKAKRLVVLHSDENSTQVEYSPPFPEIMTASYDEDISPQGSSPHYGVQCAIPVKRTQSAGNVLQGGLLPPRKTQLFSKNTPLFAAHSIIGLPVNSAGETKPRNSSLENKNVNRGQRGPSLEELLEVFNEGVEELNIPEKITPAKIVNGQVNEPITTQVAVEQVVRIPIDLKRTEAVAQVSVSRLTPAVDPPWTEVSKKLVSIDKHMLDLLTLGEQLNNPTLIPRHSSVSSLSQISDSGFQTPEIVDSPKSQTAIFLRDFNTAGLRNQFDKTPPATEKEKVQAATKICYHLRGNNNNNNNMPREASQESLATGSLSFATAPSELANSVDSLHMLPTYCMKAQVMSKPQSLRASIESIPRPTFGLIIAQKTQETKEPQKAPVIPARNLQLNRSQIKPTFGSIFALGVSEEQSPINRSTFAGSMPALQVSDSSTKSSRQSPIRREPKKLPLRLTEDHKFSGPIGCRQDFNESLNKAARKVDQMLNIAKSREQSTGRPSPATSFRLMSQSDRNISTVDWKKSGVKELSLEPLNNIQEEFRRESEMIRDYHKQRSNTQTQQSKDHWLYPEPEPKARIQRKKAPEPCFALVGRVEEEDETMTNSYLDGRRDFTRKWLEGDLSSLKMVDPVKPDLLQFGPRDADQRSIGSCSAEIAMIISKDKQEIRRHKKMQLMHHVPDIVPQKHQAVIKPSPVKFSSYQDISTQQHIENSYLHPTKPQPPIRKDSLSSVDSARILLDRFLQPKLPWLNNKPPQSNYLNPGTRQYNPHGSRSSVRSDSNLIRRQPEGISNHPHRISTHLSNFGKRFESYDTLHERRDQMPKRLNQDGMYAESTHSLPVDINSYVTQPKSLAETRGVKKLSHSSLEAGFSAGEMMLDDSTSTLTESDSAKKLRANKYLWNSNNHHVQSPQVRPGGDLLDAVDNLVAELELNTEEMDNKGCSFPTQPVPRDGFDIVTCDDTPKAHRKYQPVKNKRSTQSSSNPPEGIYGSLPVLQRGGPIHCQRVHQPLQPLSLSNSTRRAPSLQGSTTSSQRRRNPFQIINEEHIAEPKVSSLRENLERSSHGSETVVANLSSVQRYHPVSLGDALSPSSFNHSQSSSFGRLSPFQSPQPPLNHNQFLPISSIIPNHPQFQPPSVRSDRPFSNPNDILDATGSLGVLRKKTVSRNKEDDDDYDNIPALNLKNGNPGTTTKHRQEARAMLNQVLHVDTQPPLNYRAGLRSPNSAIKIDSHVLNSPDSSTGSGTGNSKNPFKNFFRRRKAESRDASNLSLQQTQPSPQFSEMHKTKSYAENLTHNEPKKRARQSKLTAWMAKRKP